MKQIRCECGCLYSVPVDVPQQGRCPACGRDARGLGDMPTQEGLTVTLDRPAGDRPAQDRPPDDQTQIAAGLTLPRGQEVPTYDFADYSEQPAAGDSEATYISPAARDETDLIPAQTDAEAPPTGSHDWPVADLPERSEVPAIAMPEESEFIGWQVVRAIDHSRHLIAAIVILGALLVYFVNNYHERMEYQEGMANYNAQMDQIRRADQNSLSFDAQQVAYHSYLTALEEYRRGQTAHADEMLRALATLYPESVWGKKAADLLNDRPPE